MQKTTYLCDQCKKEFGDKKHISLHISHSDYSGIAVPPGTALVQIVKGQLVSTEEVTNRWRVMHQLRGHLLHFCNGVCVGRYFGALMKKPPTSE